LANVVDPALGDDVPLGNAGKTHTLQTSNGFNVGFVGVGEREWLGTINSLPPVKYLSASETARKYAAELSNEQGVDIVIAVTHAREPNDEKLARQTGSQILPIILGGHDHFYSHKIVNDTHVLRSGTDFKQLSYIEAWKTLDKWEFRVTRRDVISKIPENPEALALVEKLTRALKTRLERPIGYTLAPLDARFTTVRLKESNIGNFVCDLMKNYYQTDCCIMAGGTIRGDQIYPPGVLKLKDIMNWYVLGVLQRY
jgi:5'-nucleotidase